MNDREITAQILDDLEDDDLSVNDFDMYSYIANCVIRLHMACDGAASDDGVGFASMHTRMGKSLGDRLLNGYLMSEKSIKWCKKCLPYYKNTQLAYIEWETFNACAEIITEDARERDKRYKEGYALIDQQIKDNQADAINTFLTSPIEQIRERHRPAAASMRGYHARTGRLTPGQIKYALNILKDSAADKLHREIYYVNPNVTKI